MEGRGSVCGPSVCSSSGQQPQDSLEGSRFGTIDAFATAGREKHTVMTLLLLLPALGRTTPPSPCAQPGAGLMPPACWAVSLKE